MSGLTQNLMQIHCSSCSFWMWQSHSTHAHSLASTTPTDYYAEVIIAHACALQATLLDCQVTAMSCKALSFLNSGWTFSRQTIIYIHAHIYVNIYEYIYKYIFIVCVWVLLQFRNLEMKKNSSHWIVDACMTSEVRFESHLSQCLYDTFSNLRFFFLIWI